LPKNIPVGNVWKISQINHQTGIERVKILKVSDLYQVNLEKFMHKYNADILPSSFDNLFSKLHCIHDYGTRQQVSGIFHHKRVRTDFMAKKCGNMQVLLHGFAFLMILKCYHYIRFPIE